MDEIKKNMKKFNETNESKLEYMKHLMVIVVHSRDRQQSRQKQ